jgi:hypothetical protein
VCVKVIKLLKRVFFSLFFLCQKKSKGIEKKRSSCLKVNRGEKKRKNWGSKISFKMEFITEFFYDNATFYDSTFTMDYENSTILDNLTVTEVPYVQYEDRLETYIIPTIFALIFIIGVLGNGCLILIFFRHRTMRNVPNTWVNAKIIFLYLFHY